MKVQVPDLKCNYDILYIVGSASCDKKSHSKHQTLDQCASGSGQGEDILLHEYLGTVYKEVGRRGVSIHWTDLFASKNHFYAL